MTKKKDEVNIEDLVEEVEEERVDVDSLPTIINPKWTSLVLDSLDDSELPNGNPTVAGLRRVALIHGYDIVQSQSSVVHYDGTICAVQHNITALHAGNLVEVNGVIDIRRDQLPKPFNEHLLSSADTRAEGKALRLLLRLNIVTSEEVYTEADAEDLELSSASSEPITDQQVLGFSQMCKRNDINAVKLIKIHCPEVKHYAELTRTHGQKLLNAISNHTRNPDEVGEEVQGYEEGWKEAFTKKKRGKK